MTLMTWRCAIGALMLASLASLATTAAAAAAAAAAEPDLQFLMAPSVPGPGPLGAAQVPAANVLRHYPGDPIELGVTAYLAGAVVPDLDNAHLIPQLSVCLLLGSGHGPALNAGEDMPCTTVSGVSWSIDAVTDGTSHLRANITATGSELPAGAYTIVAVLEVPALRGLFRDRAEIELRSSPVVIVAGPPTNDDEALSRLLWQGRTAETRGDHATALARADAILAVHPKSVLALSLRGHAKQELGSVADALASYTTALLYLENGQDTRTPQLADDNTWAAQVSALKQVIEELSLPPDDE